MNLTQKLDLTPHQGEIHWAPDLSKRVIADLRAHALAGRDEDLTDVLAHAAIDALEEVAVLRELLTATLRRLHTSTMTVRRQQEWLRAAARARRVAA